MTASEEAKKTIDEMMENTPIKFELLLGNDVRERMQKCYELGFKHGSLIEGEQNDSV